MLLIAFDKLLTKRELTIVLKVEKRAPAIPVDNSFRFERLRMKSCQGRG